MVAWYLWCHARLGQSRPLHGLPALRNSDESASPKMATNMTAFKEHLTLGRHIGFVVAAHVWVAALHFLALPVLTKSLGPTYYGIWSVLNVTISLAAPFALLGFSMSLVRFLAAERQTSVIRDDFLSACGVVLLTGTALSLILYILSETIATYVFQEPDAAAFLRLGSALVALNAVHTLPLAFFRMRRRLGMHALLTIIHQTLVTGGMITALALGYGLHAVIFASICAHVLFCVGSGALIIKRIGPAMPSFSNIGTYLRWGIPLTPNSAILWIIHSSDRYMVSFFLGVAATGVYGAAYALGHYASFFLMPLQTVLYPNIVKTYAEGRHEETAEYLRRAIKYVMMVSIPSAFGLSILGEPLLRILTTPEFAAGAAVIPPVAAGMVLFCFYQLMVGILHITDHTHINVRVLSTCAAVNIGLNLLLIPRMGISGAAWATVAAYGLLGLMTIAVTRRYFRFSLGLSFVAKSVAASLVMSVCLYVIAPDSVAGILTSIVAGTLVYFAALFALKGISTTEVKFFVSVGRSFLQRD